MKKKTKRLPQVMECQKKGCEVVISSLWGYCGEHSKPNPNQTTEQGYLKMARPPCKTIKCSNTAHHKEHCAPCFEAYCTGLKDAPEKPCTPEREAHPHNETGSKVPTYYLGRTGKPAWDSITEFELGYNLGCALKYIVRAGKKTPDAEKDLRKAIHCIEKQIEDLKNV